MKHIVLIFILLIFGCRQQNKLKCDDCYAVVNTNIIDVEMGQVNPGMSLIVQGNTISEVAKAKLIQIPEGATVIDGEGKYVIPGLWDMHAHTSSDAITREAAYPLFIANGVTGIRNMKADCYNEEYPCDKYNIATIDISKKWNDDVAHSHLIGPRSILGSQFVNGPRGQSSTVLSPGTPADGKALVRFLKTRGVDFIKIYEECPRDVFFAVAEEAKKQHLPFAGHVPFQVKTSEVAQSGMKSIEHCCDENYMLECSEIEDKLRDKWLKRIENKTFNMGEIILEMARTYDSVKCDRVFNILKENGVWVVPTLIVSESHYPFLFDWTKDERLKYLPQSEKQLWEAFTADYYAVYGDWSKEKQLEMRKRRFQIISAMHDKGIQIMAGTDCGSIGVFWGSSIHEELELLVKVGFSNAEALKSATLNPAIFLKKVDSLGTVKKYKLADLVILDKNPLIDIRNTKTINSVFSNGHFYDRKTLDSILETVAMDAKK